MELIDEILKAGNLTQSSQEVIRNKGAAGIDGMSVKELKDYLDTHRETLVQEIKNATIVPKQFEVKKFQRRMEKFDC